MNVPRPPSPREQIAFLRSFQRLLDEGSFVATYKFALLHAFADMCVRQGDDSGAALELSTGDIADHFIRLYWPQVMPFVTSEEEKILRQNTGRQAAVVRQVQEAHERYDGSLAMLRRDGPEWGRLVRSVQRTVEVMPLWRLQFRPSAPIGSSSSTRTWVVGVRSCWSRASRTASAPSIRCSRT